MAKITANGSHEIARWALTMRTEDHDWEVPVGSALLRSDGVVLRKSVIKGDRWTRAFKLRDRDESDSWKIELASRALERRGYILRRV